MTNSMKRLLFAAFCAICATSAHAQSFTNYQLSNGLGATYKFGAFQCGSILCAASVPIDYNGNPMVGVAGSASNYGLTIQGMSGGQPVPVTGTFTASLGGFTPSSSGARGTPLSVTTSGTSGSLPNGAVSVVSNAGSNPMYCNVNGVAATISDHPIEAGAWFAFTIPNGVSTLNCISTGGSTTANTVGGSGLPTGVGGIGSGSGGGGNVNVTQWNSVAVGNPTTWGTAPTGLAVIGVNADVLSLPSLPAGSNTIGAISNASFGASQSGTWTVQPGNTPNTSPWLFTINQGGNSAAVNGSGQLSVNCANCSGSGVSQQDATTFTQGTTDFVPVGGIFTNSVSNLTSGQAGIARLNNDRTLMGDLTEVGGSSLALGQTTMSASIPVAIASNQGAIPASQSGSWAVTANAGTGTFTVSDSTTHTDLSTINTTLGSPFQAGGSVGNTGFNALQGGSANAVGNPFYVSPATGAVFGTNTAQWGGASLGAASAVGTAATGNVPTVNSYAVGGNGAAAAGSSAPIALPILNHGSVTSLGTSLVVKASAGDLDSLNCTAIAGGAAGYCVAYNATSVPATGALTGSLVLDSCQFDTTSRGCSLAHINGSIAFSSGIVILMTSAASPFTYTTGTDTGYIEADYN